MLLINIVLFVNVWGWNFKNLTLETLTFICVKFYATPCHLTKVFHMQQTWKTWKTWSNIQLNELGVFKKFRATSSNLEGFLSFTLAEKHYDSLILALWILKNFFSRNRKISFSFKYFLSLKVVQWILRLKLRGTNLD